QIRQQLARDGGAQAGAQVVPGAAAVAVAAGRDVVEVVGVHAGVGRQLVKGRQRLGGPGEGRQAVADADLVGEGDEAAPAGGGQARAADEEVVVEPAVRRPAVERVVDRNA